MSKRLKSLRERRDGGEQSSPQEPPPPYTEMREGTPSSQTQPQPPSVQEVEVEKGASQDNPGDRPGLDEDKTLDEILDSLVLEDDHWSVSEDGGDDDSKKVEELLARLGEKPPASAGDAPQDTEEAEDDDDSEGEEMSHKVNDVLARTMDDLGLEASGSPRELPDASEPPGHDTAQTNTKSSPKDLQDPPDSTLSLPAVPHTPTHEETLPDLPATPQERKQDASSGLSLPAVPTILQDPVPSSKAGDPFESSIAARLAALKGPGHKPIATDSFGLPSAPTFQPEDHREAAESPAQGSWRKNRSGGAGYTDDDQKTWCVVCLEDATVRCVGCEGDVYCARCWREMHVGPAAGWDERGHRWEKFDPRGVK